LTVSCPASLTADDKERSLFEEVAHDIALALHGIELEEESARSEQALKEYSERLEEMVEERTTELKEAQEQLARALRQRGLLVPVVVMTGHPLGKTSELRDAGIVDWLRKPSTITQLAQLVARVLAGEPRPA
jgi:DNA-binding NtrC family response regulator